MNLQQEKLYRSFVDCLLKKNVMFLDLKVLLPPDTLPDLYKQLNRKYGQSGEG